MTPTLRRTAGRLALATLVLSSLAAAFAVGFGVGFYEAWEMWVRR
jgi:hypothetical protein